MLSKLAFFAIAVLLAQAPSERAEWRRIGAPFTARFPRDHGAHLDVRTEWWYATGELADESGERFGYELTIFRQGLDPSLPEPSQSGLRARHVFAAHLALVDVAAGKLVHAERVRRATPGLAEASESDLDARLDAWTMQRREDGTLALAALDRDAAIGIALELAPSKPLVMHGPGGVSEKGQEPGNASAYMSWTRLATRGHITIGGREIAVAGESWFDHEWGTSQLGAGVVGWDWFGLRLADGREVMLYRLRRADGSAAAQSACTVVMRDGATASLSSADFALESLATWTAPDGHAYPSRWKLAIAAHGIAVEIATQVEDCIVDGRASTGTVYWEGPVRVTGSVKGSGYGELTGYSGSLEKRF
jgi:predicted secreted hydrolase